MKCTSVIFASPEHFSLDKNPLFIAINSYTGRQAVCSCTRSLAKHELFNQGIAVHSSHVKMDDTEDVMGLVCATVLISMPFTAAAPIMCSKSA